MAQTTTADRRVATRHRSAGPVCIGCGDPVDLATAPAAAVGAQVGKFCECCAFWCDGNLVGAR